MRDSYLPQESLLHPKPILAKYLTPALCLKIASVVNINLQSIAVSEMKRPLEKQSCPLPT